MWGGRDVGELQCMAIAVLGNCSVDKSRCGRVMVRGSCGIRVSQISRKSPYEWHSLSNHPWVDIIEGNSHHMAIGFTQS